MSSLKNINVSLKRINRENGRAPEVFWILLSVVCAFAFLLIASKSSPLYPMNDWVDMHCFLTVGRGWKEGLLPYRDLVEQKGPLLYAVYAAVSALSSNSFAAVFLLEVAAFSIFLWICSKIIRLNLENAHGVATGLIVMTACIVVSKAFCHGGSLEETAMFLPAYSIYAVIRAQKEQRLLAFREAFIQGLCAGVCLMIKYTICGFYLGLALAVAIWYMRRKAYKALFRIIGGFLLGVFLLTGIIVLYFAMNSALNDFWEGYFYNNIFIYTGRMEKRTFLEAVWSAVSQTIKGTVVRLGENITYAVLIVLGFGYLAFQREREILMTVLLSFVCLAFTTFFTQWSCTYYVLILAPFSVFGSACIGSVIQTVMKRRKVNTWVSTGFLAVIFLFCLGNVYRKSDNTYLMRYEKEDMPQYRFAEIIKKKQDATLLNYGFLDGGFYFAAEAKTASRYFCRLMANIPGMMEAQKNCIEEGNADFIITQNQKLSDSPWIDSSRYELIDEASFRFENDVPIYYLYQKR